MPATQTAIPGVATDKSLTRCVVFISTGRFPYHAPNTSTTVMATSREKTLTVRVSERSVRRRAASPSPPAPPSLFPPPPPPPEVEVDEEDEDDDEVFEELELELEEVELVLVDFEDEDEELEVDCPDPAMVAPGAVWVAAAAVVNSRSTTLTSTMVSNKARLYESLIAVAINNSLQEADQ